MTDDLQPLVEMDCYDAIEITARSAYSVHRRVAETARRCADLWNDPPHSAMQRDIVADVFPELADALDELLGGGPVS
jgi:hypothetical protein